MGVCKSKPYCKYNSIQSEVADNQAQTRKLKAAAAMHSIIISNCQAITDATNDKIDELQKRYTQHKLTNENLQKQLILLKNEQKEKKQMNNKYKEQLDIQKSVALKREQKMQFILTEIENVRQIHKQNYCETNKNDMLSITDTLYLVEGTNPHKLTWNNESKKCVVFTDTINCLFYYDDIDLKHMYVNDIITNKRNKPWFLAIGEKQSALFVADNIEIRDKWVNFIKQSIHKQNYLMREL
eukprot:877622_1